ncbi:MAG: hypothetical protein ABMB14_12705, partial [Myxococcota bacterium]
MAVRVRKLARELERSPDDLLLLLKDLGYDRFRSGDDMVSEQVADQLRKAARKTPPRSLASDRPPPRVVAELHPPEASAGGDFMASLVPGVVRRSAAATAPFEPSPGRVALDEQRLVAERAAFESERDAFEATRGALRAEREALDAERRQLDALGMQLAHAESELGAAKAAFEAAQAAGAEGSLLALLEERGLRGVDEAERAIAALAAHHAVGRWLGLLVPTDPAAVRRGLAERLVLVAGPVPDGFGVPAVTVSEDRAE